MKCFAKIKGRIPTCVREEQGRKQKDAVYRVSICQGSLMGAGGGSKQTLIAESDGETGKIEARRLCFSRENRSGRKDG